MILLIHSTDSSAEGVLCKAVLGKILKSKCIDLDQDTFCHNKGVELTQARNLEITTGYLEANNYR